MEVDIAWIMQEWRDRLRLFHSNKWSNMAEMEYNLEEYSMDKNENHACCFCDEDPCIWKTHKDSILAWDTAEHGSLLDDAQILTPNIRRKQLYR
jgi:hypothetical protein